MRFTLVILSLVCGFPGSAASQLSNVSFSTTEGTWVSLDIAPSGQTLAFELLGDVYVLPAQGGIAQPILTGRAFQSQPRFSPDGSLLVYVSDESGSDNVWIAEADGSNPRQLTSVNRSTLLSPAWSPAGDAIYVTVVSGGFQTAAAEIWRYELDTGAGARVIENTNGAPAPLVSAPTPGAYGAAPSPDGAAVYYTSVTPRPYGSRNGASSAVMRFDVATGQTEIVSLDGTNAMKPAVSPNGNLLVYAAVKDGQTGLKVRDLVLGDERWLVYPIQRHQLEGRATRDVLPNYAIAPDGESVFLEQAGQIRRVQINDASQTTVAFEAAVSLDVEPRLKFPRSVETGPVRPRMAEQLAVGPNGRIAFSAMARIWVAENGRTSTRRLTNTDRPREFMPAWSPDGEWVAYVTWNEVGGHLWKVRADGNGDPIRLSRRAALWADPVWSPDGTDLIAITAPLGSTRRSAGVVPSDAELVTVPAEGGEYRALLAARGYRHPHFSNDEDRVYLSGTAGLISVGLSNGDERVELRTPPRSGISQLRLSPDVSSILAATNRGVMRYSVPSQGLTGAEISVDEMTSVSPDRASSVAWSTDGAAISWLDGTVLSTARIAGERPTRIQLDVETPTKTPTGSVVLRGATIITMRDYEVIESGDIVVTNDRIAAVGARGVVDVPEGATVIDVSGKYIVPGFIDVHAHFGASNEMLEPESSTSFANLAYGITTLRNPQASLDVFALAEVIEADAVPGPRIFSTGPGLFASLNLQSADAARQTVQRYRDEYGTQLLKSYMVGTRQQRQWVVQAAREFEMMPTTEGGADTKMDITHALDGFSGNEHAFPVAPIYDDVVQLVARTGMTYTPTLVVSFGAALPIYRLHAQERPHEDIRANRWFADGELYANSSSRLLWFPPEDYNDVEAARGANAILQAGGNVALGGHGEVQGLSNHWEMKLLARGGMKPHDVLRVATIFGAEAIGVSRDLGSLEPGKLADLVVLDRNPLANIESTQTIRHVMKNGFLYDGETLDQQWPQQIKFIRPWWLERPSGPAGVMTSIDEDVRQTMADARIPGVAVAVVKEGQVLLSKGYGIANLETGTKVTPETMFQVGSVGKQFTSAGIMALVEDGRIDLDASVRTYLREAPTSWQPITIRHLLTHSSGIPDYTSDEFDYETNYTEEDLVRMASGLELEFPAGARWNYSNTGYVMLGVVISRVVGKPYWEFLEERIFRPAGMSTIRVNTQSDIVPNRAQGYIPVDGGWQHPGYVAPNTNTTADGSMLVSLHDFIAWNELVRNRDILTPESWEQILSPMTLNSGRSYPYGFGWFLGNVGGQIVHEHGGAWQGFIAQITRFTEDDLAVMVLSNARNLGVPGLANRIAATINPALTQPPPPTTPIEDTDPDATRYVRAMLEKTSRGELALEDFAFVRQTIFPRIRAALTRTLDGFDTPDRMELLSKREVGDDREFQYWVWYGDQRFRVLVSLAPSGGLTALRVIPERETGDKRETGDGRRETRDGRR